MTLEKEMLVKANGAPLGLPSPLLSHLADLHAETLAVIWPAPHAEYFILPTARRHAAAILTSALKARHTLSNDGLKRLVERQKDKVIAETIVGPGFAAGFMKAMAKCGETLWNEADYVSLIQLWQTSEAQLYLRHLKEIRPSMLELMSILPAGLRQAGVMSFIPGKVAARHITLACQIIDRLHGDAAHKRAIERWTKAKEQKRLFEMIGEDLVADKPVAFQVPPELSAPFRRVQSVKELRATALEFKNCLMDYADQFLSGKMAIYVWRGTPNAAVALMWNFDGWRLAEAEAADNEELAETPLREIVDQLVLHNVRIGPSIRSLKQKMDHYAFAEPAANKGTNLTDLSFVEACDLGDLWS